MTDMIKRDEFRVVREMSVGILIPGSKEIVPSILRTRQIKSEDLVIECGDEDDPVFVGWTTGDVQHGFVYRTGNVDGCTGYCFEFCVLAWEIVSWGLV